ncbi:hypothetical protein BN1723_012293, partial [Verticillium longisporum]
MASRWQGRKLFTQLSAQSRIATKQQQQHLYRYPLRFGARFNSSEPQLTAQKSSYTPNYLLISAVGLSLAGTLGYKMAVQEPDQLDGPSLAERDALTKKEAGVTSDAPMRLRMEKFIKEQQDEIVW